MGMMLVTLTRDMRPYQVGHDAALPDAVAQKLIDAGDAKLSAAHAASGLRPDGERDTPPGSSAPTVQPPLPRGRYITRKGR